MLSTGNYRDLTAAAAEAAIDAMEAQSRFPRHETWVIRFKSEVNIKSPWFI